MLLTAFSDKWSDRKKRYPKSLLYKHLTLICQHNSQIHSVLEMLLIIIALLI